MESTVEQIANAIDFSMHDASVYVSKKSGEVILDAEMYNGEVCPIENIEENSDFVCLPTKSELKLGIALVFKFIRLRFPEDVHTVEKIFKKRGAYSRFKAFLDDKEALKEWYAFEEQEKLRVISDWCEFEGINRTP